MKLNEVIMVLDSKDGAEGRTTSFGALCAHNIAIRGSLCPQERGRGKTARRIQGFKGEIQVINEIILFLTISDSQLCNSGQLTCTTNDLWGNLPKGHIGLINNPPQMVNKALFY